MVENNDIRDEIKSIAPTLSALKFDAVALPDMPYFEQMQQQVLDRLDIKTAKNTLPAPSYFEQMQDRVIQSTLKTNKTIWILSNYTKQIAAFAATFLIFALALWMWNQNLSNASISRFDRLEEEKLVVLIEDLTMDEWFDLLSHDEYIELNLEYFSDFDEDILNLDITPLYY